MKGLRKLFPGLSYGWGEIGIETVNGLKELQELKTLCLSLPGLQPKDQVALPSTWPWAVE